MGVSDEITMATATVVTWTLLVGSAFGLARLDVTMNDVSYSTVKAVPLEKRSDSTTQANSATTIVAMREDATDMSSSMMDSSSTSTTHSNNVFASSTILPEGMIPWSPYRGRGKRMREPKRRPIHRQPKRRSVEESTVASNKASPLKSPMVLFPKLSAAKGRWQSRDKIETKLLNIRPAFLLPVVEVDPTRPDSMDQQRPMEMAPHPLIDTTRTVVKRATREQNPAVAACGGEFRELYGVLKSPEFPLYYPNNKECMYNIELPSENYTIKITCDAFTLQGGENCTHDYIELYTNATSAGERYCGAESPVIHIESHQLKIKFVSDDLFRYQGFSCRYRALQPNGIAVVGSFGNTSDTTKPKTVGNSFLQVVQCPSIGDSAALDGDGGEDGEGGAGVSFHSGLWNGRCGNQNLPPTSRIVGGYNTKEHQFPWIAAVLKSCGDEYCHICGGTIISEEWIMTGAHCMAHIDRNDLGVLVGDHNLFSVSNDQKFLRVKEKVIHPDFNTPTPLNNDIGLLRLEHPIVFTKYISPLCLPALGETGFGTSAYGNVNTTLLDTAGLDIVGRNATVLGWGMINDDGVYSDGLRGVEVEILDNDECNRLYGIMTETLMCTSGNNGRGTCYGDSGGPAVVLQPDGSYVQVGILAFGALAGCEIGYPSGQVLVHKYIDWIQLITGIAFGSHTG